MAHFVVIWSMQFLLLVSCLTLCKAKVVLQQATILPDTDNVAINEIDEDVAQHVGVGGDVGVVDSHVVANEVDSGTNQQRVYHPAVASKPRIIEQYDHRSLDGQYEYRYVLSNGETRYERAYWLPLGENMVLARKGYYSHLLKNNKYLTVFYTADQNGFREDSSTYSRSQPNLPRSVKVPEYAPPSTTHAPVTHRPHVYTSTTTRRPYVPVADDPFIQWYPSNVPQTPIHQSSVSSSNQAQSSHGHHSQAHPSSWGGHSSSGGQTSAEQSHHSADVHTSSGIPSSWGVPQPIVSNPVTTNPSVLSQSWHSSGVYSSSGIPSHSGVHPTSDASSSTGAQSPSGMHTSSGVHSSVGAQTSSGVHIASGVHTSSGAHTTLGVHTSSGAHSTSTVHNSSRVPSHSVAQSQSNHPSQHHQAAHGSTHNPTTVAQPTTSSTSVPVQSWHYSF